MSGGSRAWVRDREEEPLGCGFSYSVARICESDGELREFNERVMVGSRGSIVVMLSASAGMLHADSRVVLDAALGDLLDAVGEGVAIGEPSVITVRQRLLAMFQAGAFCHAVPNGVVAGVSSLGLRGFRFGPVGLAVVDNGVVRLLHADDRFPALRNQGIRLEDFLSASTQLSPYMEAVSSLAQLELESPPDLLSAGIPNLGSVMLMSRGALPLCIPGPRGSLDAWAGSDAGWRHGMSGTIVQIYRSDARPKEELAWLRARAR